MSLIESNVTQQSQVNFQELINDIFSLFFNAMVGEMFATVYTPEEANEKMDKLYSAILAKFDNLLQDLAKNDMNSYFQFKKIINEIFEMNKKSILADCEAKHPKKEKEES